MSKRKADMIELKTIPSKSQALFFEESKGEDYNNTLIKLTFYKNAFYRAISSIKLKELFSRDGMPVHFCNYQCFGSHDFDDKNFYQAIFSYFNEDLALFELGEFEEDSFRIIPKPHQARTGTGILNIEDFNEFFFINRIFILEPVDKKQFTKSIARFMEKVGIYEMPEIVKLPFSNIIDAQLSLKLEKNIPTPESSYMFDL